MSSNVGFDDERGFFTAVNNHTNVCCVMNEKYLNNILNGPPDNVLRKLFLERMPEGALIALTIVHAQHKDKARKSHFPLCTWGVLGDEG